MKISLTTTKGRARTKLAEVQAPVSSVPSPTETGNAVEAYVEGQRFLVFDSVEEYNRYAAEGLVGPPLDGRTPGKIRFTLTTV